MTWWRVWRTRLALFAMVVGPGIITANVDNDAGGIATYSVAGAQYGYRLLWVLVPTCIFSILALEMCSRMGVATGKGLSALLRERFGVGPSFYVMLALILVNLGNEIANFAGVASGAALFNIPPLLSVPCGAFLIWHIVVKGTYRSVERWFFVAVAFYITYIISGFLAKPDWSATVSGAVVPRIQWNAGYLSMMVGLVGTTIAPWMQFYQQASVVEKGIPLKHYRYARMDVILGGVLVMIVQVFIVVTCAAVLNPANEVRATSPIETASDAAKALRPLAGDYCGHLFAIGLISASFFGATILPISTSTSVCEAMGWARGVDRKFTEAPQYYLIYTLIIVVGATVALVAGEHALIPIMLVSQVINGVLLPVVVFFMLRITSDRAIMGKHANGRLFNIAAWAGTTIVAVMSLVMVVLTLAGV